MLNNLNMINQSRELMRQSAIQYAALHNRRHSPLWFKLLVIAGMVLVLGIVGSNDYALALRGVSL